MHCNRSALIGTGQVGMATIYDVAEECGFSLATVSNVINNGSRPVRPETKRLILEAVERLNYHPSAVARGLARQRTHAIGILFGFVQLSEIVINAYSAAVLQAVLSVAAETGYNVTHLTPRWEGAEKSLREFRDGRTDGLLVVAPPTDSDLLPALASIGVPLVAVSPGKGQAAVPAVDVDDVFGATLAMRHLLDLGHRRIAHIAGNPNLESAAVRMGVFRESLEALGIELDEQYVGQGSYSPACGYAHTRRLMSLPVPPTAIFAGNDEIAFGVLEAAREMGIEVPRQLSVVAVDDRPMASLMSPGLTTLHQPFDEVGREATRRLIDAIEGKPVSTDTVLFEPRLIVRDSTAPPGT